MQKMNFKKRKQFDRLWSHCTTWRDCFAKRIADDVCNDLTPTAYCKKMYMRHKKYIAWLIDLENK